MEQLRKMRADTVAREQAAQAAAADDQAVVQNADRLNKPVAPGSMLQEIIKKRMQPAGRTAAPAGAAP